MKETSEWHPHEYNLFDSLVEPLRYIFSNSLAQEIFLEEMKIAQITPIYKGGDKENIVKL